MSWKMTRTGVPIRFEPGEPICMIYPEVRGLVERFQPEVRELEDHPELKRAHEAWNESPVPVQSESDCGFRKDMGTALLSRYSYGI
jgi:Family of unknown function (DUF6065)